MGLALKTSANFRDMYLEVLQTFFFLSILSTLMKTLQEVCGKYDEQISTFRCTVNLKSMHRFFFA